MGNCFGTRRTSVDHYRYVQPHAPACTKEPYKSSSKKLTHPLPVPPPQQMSTYPQKVLSPNGKKKTEMMIVSPHLKSFTLSELKDATRCFCPDYLLGEGKFGYTYKGWLNKETLAPAKPGSGMAVAVKKLKPQGFQAHEEWLSETTYLGGVHHENVVDLMGFCYESEKRMLVYEFMPKGSLENHLFRQGAQLSWALRLKVAAEAAQGLAFLHALETKIIYCDFKSSNILLDRDYKAKLSDFGLAKAGPLGDQTHVAYQVMGTIGYTAPEYTTTGRLTTKSDVYSFGIVLLELITGRRAIDYKRIANEKILLEWVRPHLIDAKKLFRIMDSRLEGQYSRNEAYVVANLALQCCHPKASYRPHMSDVQSILENIRSPKANSNSKMSSSKSITNAHRPDGHSIGQQHGSSVTVAIITGGLNIDAS